MIKVMLCERGVRTFEGHTRFTLPLASVSYLHRKTHLPVIIDPSHGTGHAYMVPDMAVAAAAAGADGLIIEVHPDPSTALSDGYQSLTFDEFEKTMKRLQCCCGCFAYGGRLRPKGVNVMNAQDKTLDQYQQL